MVAMEPLVLVQAHRAQGGADSPASRSEYGTCREHLSVPKDTLGEKWREGFQKPYHRDRWGTHLQLTSFSGDCGDERTLPLSLPFG